ncbi:MAG: dTMP kinase [Streptococcaceae bacterium]|jgi:dTMP kinase|nr:dTMP kinase [Streptococcaceae bacterium]
MKGIFITVEGSEGSGKTSLIQGLLPLLAERSNALVMTTREPGGIPLAERIRDIILDLQSEEMDEKTESLLFAASRREHLVKKILPALEEGKLIIADRFVDSSLAYQGVGRGLGIETIAALNAFVTEGLEPDLTLYLDLKPKEGLARIQQNRANEVNRLDLLGLKFHQKVHVGYLKIAKENPQRVVVINAQQALAKVIADCFEVIIHRFPKLFKEKSSDNLK